jgi:hypothetical protein
MFLCNGNIYHSQKQNNRKHEKKSDETHKEFFHFLGFCLALSVFRKGFLLNEFIQILLLPFYDK